MLGPIGASLMSIMRVLTPSEIDRYVDVQSDTKATQLRAVGGETMSFDERESHMEDSYKGPPEKEKSQAKIIPISDFQKDKKDPKSQQKGPPKSLIGPPPNNIHEFHPHEEDYLPGQSSHLDELESIGIFTSSHLKEEQERKIAKEKSGQESTTVFILSQREKLLDSTKKLVGQSAIKEYQVTSSQEIVQRDLTEDDYDEDGELLASGSKGILVNKKHY